MALSVLHARLSIIRTNPCKYYPKGFITTRMSTQGAHRNPRKNRPRNESHNVALSKKLSYYLRHGLDQAGLTARKDGYVRLDELVFPFSEVNI
jgi:RNA:NAD 2'-phosphotransferase (TPT1/KptA family)